ncbi:MAG TPA: hypothetical protein VGJ30_01940, partial [Candidatus Angelobacter sp.]
PRPFFELLLQTKDFCHSMLGPPLRDAWVALGPRLGHPRATQASRKGGPSIEWQKSFVCNKSSKKGRGEKSPGSPTSHGIARDQKSKTSELYANLGCAWNDLG